MNIIGRGALTIALAAALAVPALAQEGDAAGREGLP
jgi:hypothetical protein